MTFVCSVALVLTILVLVARGSMHTSWRSAGLSGTALALLPLTGATGLLYVPALALWFLWLGMSRARRSGPERAAGITLVTSAILAIALSGLYFVGYQPAKWGAPQPEFGTKLLAAFQAVTLGFGSAALNLPQAAIPLAVSFLIPSVIYGIRAIRQASKQERAQLCGFVVYVGGALVYMLALGFVRSGVITFVYGSWPDRYALLAAPLFCGSYFVWQLCGPMRLRHLAPACLACLLLLYCPSTWPMGTAGHNGSGTEPFRCARIFSRGNQHLLS